MTRRRVPELLKSLVKPQFNESPGRFEILSERLSVFHQYFDFAFLFGQRGADLGDFIPDSLYLFILLHESIVELNFHTFHGVSGLFFGGFYASSGFVLFLRNELLGGGLFVPPRDRGVPECVFEHSHPGLGLSLSRGVGVPEFCEFVVGPLLDLSHRAGLVGLGTGELVAEFRYGEFVCGFVGRE
jgi:hypothetical protein